MHPTKSSSLPLSPVGNDSTFGGAPACGEAPKGAPLGIYAETLSLPATARVTDDGEIVGLPRDSRASRAERFLLKSAAFRLLPSDHRTRKCMRWRLPELDIQVLRSRTKERAYYHGLQVCAMPWTCPVCASKISERRRIEVANAIEQGKVLGLEVKLVTLTVPHGLGDDLPVLLDRMSRAWSRLWAGAPGKKLRDTLGLFGHIRALEVTYGANGWHPHFHALMFYHLAQVRGEGWKELPYRWQTVAVRSGLPQPSIEHGCRVDDGDKASAYVSKGVWGLESELTKGHVKKGKRGSRTPFDLLRAYQDGSKASGALWRAYSDAFQGRRQLYWSNGLRKLLAIAELTDEEIAHREEDERSILLATITDEEWSVIDRKRLYAPVLDLAEVSIEALRHFLHDLNHDRHRTSANVRRNDDDYGPELSEAA